MEIIRTKKIGFCFGVKKAIETCMEISKLEKNKKYILGMLVHNEIVVNEMRSIGFEIIDEEDLLNARVPLEKGDIVVIRAHGTTSEIIKLLIQKEVAIYDATCIFVNKIKDILIEREKLGDEIIFIGDEFHPEVKGIISFGKKIKIFKNLEELKNHELDKEISYSVLTQTTLNKKNFLEIKKFLEKHFSKINIFDKICGATSERQEATINLAKSCDVVLVIGDLKSSNTKKLFEISLSENKNTYMIQNEMELEMLKLNFSKDMKIGLTAGTSTPEKIIDTIENNIRGNVMFNDNNEFNEENFEQLLNEYMPIKENEEMKRIVKGTITSKDRNYTYLEVAGEPEQVRVKTEEIPENQIGDELEVMVLAQAEEGDSLVLIASKKRIDMEKGIKKLEEAQTNNEVVTGKIIRIVKGGFIVEAFHQNGFLPNSLAEIPLSKSETYLNKDIDVVVKEIKIDKKGNRILLSRKELVTSKEQEIIEKLNVGDVLTVEILEVLDFGLVVDVNKLKGFIHISEVDWKKTTDLHSIYKVGDKIEAKIIDIEKEKRNVKLSVKALTKNPWEILLENYKIDQIVEGKVVQIVKYGAFVEIIPNVRGLVHVSDFSWSNKNININNLVNVGDTIKVMITELDKDSKKLKLSIKQLSENPWENAEGKFAVGKKLSGKVVEVKNFGIFVKVEEGVDGFIHISDFAWNGHKTFEKDDVVEFEVIELNLDDHKIKGSIKKLTKSPWDTALEEYKVGDIIEKPIKNIQDFGMFVNLIEGVDGFIPTQLASKDFIKNIRDSFKVGDIVKSEIVEIDTEKKRIKLSIKKIQLDNEKNEDKELIDKYSVSSSEE